MTRIKESEREIGGMLEEGRNEKKREGEEEEAEGKKAEEEFHELKKPVSSVK